VTQSAGVAGIDGETGLPRRRDQLKEHMVFWAREPGPEGSAGRPDSRTSQTPNPRVGASKRSFQPEIGSALFSYV
jgi:hypothetical protein